MDIDFQIERTTDMLMEAFLLGKAHYEEVEKKKDKVGFNMDVVLMGQLVEAGLLFAATARHNGEMVGYFCTMINPDFLTQTPMSREVGIYVKPEYRGEGIYPELVKLVEEEAKAQGAHAQYVMFKAGHDTGLAEREGYELTETTYMKLLEE